MGNLYLNNFVGGPRIPKTPSILAKQGPPRDSAGTLGLVLRIWCLAWGVQGNTGFGGQSGPKPQEP